MQRIAAAQCMRALTYARERSCRRVRKDPSQPPKSPAKVSLAVSFHHRALDTERRKKMCGNECGIPLASAQHNLSRAWGCFGGERAANRE